MDKMLRSITILALTFSMAACGSFLTDARIASTTIEQTYVTAATAAASYNRLQQGNFLTQVQKAATPADLATAVAAQAAYQAKMDAAIDALNKTLVVIGTLNTAIPATSAAITDLQQKNISGAIAEGIADLIAVKNALAAFGISLPIGGN